MEERHGGDSRYDSRRSRSDRDARYGYGEGHGRSDRRVDSIREDRDRHGRDEEGGRNFRHGRDEHRRERERNGDGDRYGRDEGVRNGGHRHGRDEHRRETGREEKEVPELYSICKGKVHSIKPFGIFVRLDGYRAHGLVHLSQVSNTEVTHREDSDQVKIQALSAIVDQGEDVWVKIISVKREDDGNVKIGCSMKAVSQTNGRDLDPNNLHVDLPDRPFRPPRQKVELDAVYNVECTRCGGHGHLRSECYASMDKVYDLLPDEVQVQEDIPVKKDVPTDILENRKRSTLPDSVTTVEEAKSLIASLKKEKKRKKRDRKDSEKKHHKKKEHST